MSELKYVHIYFRPHNKKRPQWYWAIKINEQTYKRVMIDGDKCVSEHVLKDGTRVCKEELLVGKPLKERKAAMNLHYAELEEIED